MVTSCTEHSPKSLFRFYYRRGDAENRVKELKDDLSCRSFRANQFRLLLHAAAYVLLQTLRARLAGAGFASAQVSTLRLRRPTVGLQGRFYIR